MTHDPLCPMGDPSLNWVNCDWCGLIAKVRDDERDNCWAAIAEMQPRDFGELGDLKAWVAKPEALACLEALGQEKP